MRSAIGASPLGALLGVLALIVASAALGIVLYRSGASGGTDRPLLADAAYAVPSATEQPTIRPTDVPVAPSSTPAPLPAAARVGSAPGAVQRELSAPAVAPTAQPSAGDVAPPPAAAVQQADDGKCAACGTPRYFCDTWAGGFCNDYRQLGDTTLQLPFPPPSEEASFDCLSATAPEYAPSMRSGTLPFPCGFSAHEHFMTRVEDGSFGMTLMRVHRPVDLSGGRTAHIHFDVDLKTGQRRYVRLMLSPDLTKRIVDDRSASNAFPPNQLDIWFQGGGINSQLFRGGVYQGDPFFGGDPGYHGSDDVRDAVDIYISRTHFRVLINNSYVQHDVAMADIGFDVAYLYFSEVSYNPCKDGECDLPLQIFHWDNIAFDGPTLPTNALTPAGQQDVVFNMYSAEACSVGGVAATPMGPLQGYTWVTWVARMPDGPVSASDVSCTPGEGFGFSDGAPRGFEVVRPGE